jgi:hypothetical protein
MRDFRTIRTRDVYSELPQGSFGLFDIIDQPSSPHYQAMDAAASMPVAEEQ